MVQLLEHAEKHTRGFKKFSPRSIRSDIRSGDSKRRQAMVDNRIRIANPEELANIRAKYFAELADPAVKHRVNAAPHQWLATVIKYPNKTMAETLSIYLDQRGGGIETLSDVITHDSRVLSIYLSELNLEDRTRFKGIMRQFRERNTSTMGKQAIATAFGSVGTLVGAILGFCHMNYEAPDLDRSSRIAVICRELIDGRFWPD